LETIGTVSTKSSLSAWPAQQCVPQSITLRTRAATGRHRDAVACLTCGRGRRRQHPPQRATRPAPVRPPLGRPRQGAASCPARSPGAAGRGPRRLLLRPHRLHRRPRAGREGNRRPAGRLPSLPDPEALDRALAPLGWEPARGSRADSPGLTHDLPAPDGSDDDEPDWVWRKRLFTATDPARPGILHVRLAASPFGRRTVAFRDRLRAEPRLRSAYEQLKRGLAAEHANAADYDDYTRGKTTFIRGAADQ